MTPKEDRCEYPYCREEYEVIYLGKKVCDEHFEKLSKERLKNETKNQ